MHKGQVVACTATTPEQDVESEHCILSEIAIAAQGSTELPKLSGSISISPRHV